MQYGRGIMNTIEFRSQIDIDRINELEDQVKILKERIKLADKDIKRMLSHDYDVLCEFCHHNGCCFTFNGYDCKDRCYWRGRLK